jgi:putative protease
MKVDQKPDSDKATKADVVTFKTTFKVRPSDKLYKIVATELKSQT